MKSSSLIEWSLWIVLLLVTLWAVYSLFLAPDSVCVMHKDSFSCIEYRYNECLETDVFTKDDCLALTGK